jgi:hypothetical protein
MIPRQDRALRDLALFKVALDSSFQGSDLVRLRVADVATPAGVLKPRSKHLISH